MGQTANNSWNYPESSDLVKDGATAIQTLADDIDTTLGVYSASGLVLLNTTSFSAVASQSVNDVFSADYDFYRIMVNIDSTSSAGSPAFGIRLRASATDKSTGYYFNTIRLFSTTIQYPVATNLSIFNMANMGNALNATAFGYVDIAAPYANRATRFYSNFTSSGSSYEMITGGCVQTDSYQATGFTLILNTDTFTGKVNTYGYNA